MLSSTWTIVLIIHTLIFGNVFSILDTEHQHLAGSSYKTSPSSILKEFVNSIPQRFYFREEVYRIDIIQQIDSLSNYRNLYQLVQVNDGQDGFKLVQVQAVKTWSMLEVPKTFIAMYDYGAAMYKIVKEENCEDSVSHLLEHALHDIAIDGYIDTFKLVKIGHNARDKPNSDPPSFADVPEIDLTAFEYKSFSLLSRVTPSKDKNGCDCVLRSTKTGFHEELFRGWQLFKIVKDASHPRWHLELDREPAVYKRNEPRKIMVYSVSSAGTINFYEMKCEWSKKRPEVNASYLHSRDHKTLIIEKLFGNPFYDFKDVLFEEIRFSYFPFLGDESQINLLLLEHRWDASTGKLMTKHVYNEVDIFKINGLQSIVIPQHYRCSNEDRMTLLPRFPPFSMTLNMFKSQIRDVCEKRRIPLRKCNCRSKQLCKSKSSNMNIGALSQRNHCVAEVPCDAADLCEVQYVK